MPKLLVGLLLPLLLLAGCAQPTPTPTPTLTVSKVQEIRARGKLIVAVRQEQGPRGVSLDPAHPHTRTLEVALAKAIAKKLMGDENKVDLRSGPALAVASTVQGGQVDLALATIFHFPTTDALKQQVEVSEPFATGGVALVTTTGSTVRSLADLSGKRVGYVAAGRDYRPDFDTITNQQGLSIAIEGFVSYDEAATALQGGQVQAVLGHTIALTVYATQNPGRFAFLDKPLTREQFAVIAKKGDSELIGIVNEVVKELKASGELLRLAQQAGFPVESLALP
ncbi:MAG: transporter substrate-binding domain-containing protein [Chloroflexi bacterium]|nr:transporter substrate-binding domain-containing protein [Chloroflexota bacterium]